MHITKCSYFQKIGANIDITLVVGLSFLLVTDRVNFPNVEFYCASAALQAALPSIFQLQQKRKNAAAFVISRDVSNNASRIKEWANEGAMVVGRAIHAWTQAKVPPTTSSENRGRLDQAG